MFEEAAARLLSLSPHALRGAAERTLLQRNGFRGDPPDDMSVHSATLIQLAFDKEVARS